MMSHSPSLIFFNKYIALVISVACLSISMVAMSQALFVSYDVLLFFRFLFQTLIMWFISYRLADHTSWKPRLTRHDWFITVALSFFGFFLFANFTFILFDYFPPFDLSIMFILVPIVVSFLNMVYYHHYFNYLSLTAATLCALGTLFFLGCNSYEHTTLALSSIVMSLFFAFILCFCEAVWVVGTNTLLRNGLSMAQICFWVSLIAMVLFSIQVMLQGHFSLNNVHIITTHLSSMTLITLSYLGYMAFWLSGSQENSPTSCSAYTCIIPIMTIVCCSFLYHVDVHLFEVLAFILAIASMIIATNMTYREPTE